MFNVSWNQQLWASEVNLNVPTQSHLNMHCYHGFSAKKMKINGNHPSLEIRSSHVRPKWLVSIPTDGEGSILPYPTSHSKQQQLLPQPQQFLVQNPGELNSQNAKSGCISSLVVSIEIAVIIVILIAVIGLLLFLVLTIN